jgi:hypothetical protein
MFNPAERLGIPGESGEYIVYHSIYQIVKGEARHLFKPTLCGQVLAVRSPVSRRRRVCPLAKACKPMQK